MTIKEAVLKSLEDLNKLANHIEVYQHIISNRYYDFVKAKTPQATISAQLGEFIRQGDSRVKRIKEPNGSYSYYLTKNEKNIGFDTLNKITELKVQKSKEKKPTYEERDLHKLLSSYLKSIDTFSKTIFHEQSRINVDNKQIWTHPDMVGISFLYLQSKASQNLLRTISSFDTIKLSSYELKREINSDADLKKAYFQAVSNSSWANFGYLVAFEFSESLKEEMERLNQAFGIGIIELNANPFQSRVILPAKPRDLDFKTIDKLCKINKSFENFIEYAEKLLNAEDKYLSSTQRELEEFCDQYFTEDSQAEKYCKEKNIPMEDVILN